MAGIIGFCGASGSGKTTLVTKVIAELSGRGLRVGAVKHHGHPEPLTAGDGPKDSDRLLAAGAERVALSHAGGVWTFAPPQEAGPMAIAGELPAGLDVVLVEGYKTAAIDKIEVVAPGAQPMLPRAGRLVALARRGGSGTEAELPVLDADAPQAVADFVLAHLAAQSGGGIKARLVVNGKELGMKPFINRLVADTICGLVSGLKGGEDPKTIEVRIDL